MLKGIQLITNACKNTSCVRSASRVANLEGLRFAPELVTDTIKIKNKTPLAEFKRYVEGFKLEGENFIPHSENPSSAFMEYFLYRQKQCAPKPAKQIGSFFIKARPARPKIINPNDNESHIQSLMDFKAFMQTPQSSASREEYYQIVDEIARLMPEFVKCKYPQLRPEIVENSGKIYKWRTLMDVEGRGLTKLKYYDEAEKIQAIREYTQFVEELTGKKVLIGSPTRMTISADELGLLNDPASYKDVDYILFGHGTGSSLDGTWSFSDNGVNIWEFIEQNVPKGKRVLVGCCEKDGFTLSERKSLPYMYDKAGQFMYGIGDTVATSFSKCNPAKICESGKRHIIGHSMLENTRYIDSFINSAIGTAKNVYYDL